MLKFWKKLDRRFFTYSAAILAAGGLLHNSAQGDSLQKLQELRIEAPLSAAFHLDLVGVQKTHKRLPVKDGQPYLLHLWATWCVPCREELPQLATFLQQNPDLPIIPVAMESGDPDHVAAFLHRLHVTSFPAWSGDTQQLRQALSRFSEPGLPMTLLVDAHGQIRAVSDGGIQWDAPHATEIVTHLLKAVQ